MTIRWFATVEAYQRAYMKSPEELRRYDVSPGLAMALLGVSRQRVSKMVNDGVLDAVKTGDGYILMMSAEVNAYRRFVSKKGTRIERGLRGRAWAKRKRAGGFVLTKSMKSVMIEL